MSKRSPGLARAPRDLYRSFDPRIGAALHPHLDAGTIFIEPCAGEGDLIRQLERLGHRCLAACDIEPLAPGIQRGDAMKLRRLPAGAERIITNPPWKRAWLHPMIEHLAGLAPTWLLFDADWMHTDQAQELLERLCLKIISVGRLKWVENSADDGKDNHAWYLFDAAKEPGQPRFYGKGAPA